MQRCKPSSGLSGTVAALAGPFSYLFDGSNGDGPPEILLALAVGPDAERVAALHMKARKELLVEQIRRHVGEPSGPAPEFFSVDWSSDPWARGGYASRRGIGGWLRRAQSLAEPAGAIHFAGTETATEWRSYMEGAVQSGERAAAEVAQPLGAPLPSSEGGADRGTSSASGTTPD